MFKATRSPPLTLTSTSETEPDVVQPAFSGGFASAAAVTTAAISASLARPALASNKEERSRASPPRPADNAADALERTGLASEKSVSEEAYPLFSGAQLALTRPPCTAGRLAAVVLASLAVWTVCRFFRSFGSGRGAVVLASLAVWTVCSLFRSFGSGRGAVVLANLAVWTVCRFFRACGSGRGADCATARAFPCVVLPSFGVVRSSGGFEGPLSAVRGGESDGVVTPLLSSDVGCTGRGRLSLGGRFLLLLRDRSCSRDTAMCAPGR